MDVGLKVRDVMSKGVITIGPKSTVREASKIMAKHDISGLTVVERGRVVGVLTQGDIVAMLASGADPDKTRVEKVMGTEAYNISPDADIYDAAKLMVRKKVKRLPVIKKGKLLGVLTQSDLVRISPSVYDLLVERAAVEAPPPVETEMPLAGECEECGNYSEKLRNVGGELVCEDCYED